MGCLGILLLAVVVTEVSAHHCLFNCDPDTGLRYEELLAITYPYEGLSQCNDPSHCDDSTPGTGHKLFNTLTEDLIAVERCYSFCYTNVTGGIPEGITTIVDDIYAEPACSDNWKEGHVCFSACLFGLESLFDPNDPIAALVFDPNTTCSDLCTVPGGICERAFPLDTNTACTQECRIETCPQYCRLVESDFPSQSSADGLIYGGTSVLTMDYTSNVTLRKEGMLDFQVTYTPLPPPDPRFTPPPFPDFVLPSSLSSGVTYGIMWKVTYVEDGHDVEQYIPQHLPFLLLPDEVGPLYRIGSNMLAIRDLQCKDVQLSFAYVNEHGISPFIPEQSQCIYGSWFPIPPNDVSIKLGFDYSTGELRLEITSDDLSPDQEFVEGYRVQVVGFPTTNPVVPECDSRFGSNAVVNDVAFDDKVNLSLVIRGTEEVEKFFPLYDKKCKFVVGVYALPQRNSSATKDFIYAVANWKEVVIDLPDYAKIDGLTTYNVSTDPITGLSDVTFTYNVTSHWSSLAVLETVHGQLTKELLDGGTVFDPQSSHMTRRFDVTPPETVYYFRFSGIRPVKESEQYKFQRIDIFKYQNLISDTIETPTFPLPAISPSPVRNLTADVVFDLSKSKIIANLSWVGPENPYGVIDSYKIVLSSPRAASLTSTTLDVQNTAAADDLRILVEAQIIADLLEDEYFNFSVRAVSEWGVEGEWAVESVTQTLTNSPAPQQTTPAYLYGIVAAIVALVVVFAIIAGVTGYCFYRRNKVVIMKNTRIWVNGRQDAEEGQDDEEDFQPVPVDDWEISPDCIIMDTMLGEGQFGEVYKGLIKDSDISNPYFRGSEFVAVKILRPEANAALKSDFLKEIATMKKITMGSCPYLVNMVGCCTLQEPLALVLEYVPHGDLLTYMRTMRKLNTTRYFNLPSPDDIKHNGNEYVNHGGHAPYPPSVPTAMTPMTPASDCPLLGDRGISPTTPLPQVPSPYEKPYSALGELRPVHLVSFAYQVASGMKFLSELGIVHRDLACRNVLVGENKVLKISDFGLARENDIYIKTTDGKLPLRWMAVESIVDRVFTAKSDVWSFGVLLWEITTLGGHPYPSIGNKALLTHLLRGYRMDKPDNCSPDIYEIMQQCWAQDAMARPSFAELEGRLNVILSKAQSENYIDLNVDEMLPYYSMRAVEQIDEAEEEEFEAKKNDGYPDTSGITAEGFIADIERPPSSNSGNESITEVQVQLSQGEMDDASNPTVLPANTETSEKSEEKAAPPPTAELTSNVNEEDV